MDSERLKDTQQKVDEVLDNKKRPLIRFNFGLKGYPRVFLFADKKGFSSGIPAPKRKKVEIC